MASRHGQWPDPVGRCDGMLQFTGRTSRNHRRSEAVLKEAGAEGLRSNLLNRNVDQPFKYIATWLIDRWSKISAHDAARGADEPLVGHTVRGGLR